MSLAFCPHCGARYSSIPPDAAGSKVKCKGCQKSFAIELVDDNPRATLVDQGTDDTDAGLPPATLLDGPGQEPPTVAEPGAEPAATLVDGGASAPVSRALTAPGSDEWQVGEVILDLYEVKAVVGHGGMATVYRVHHRGWNVDLAVKTPLPSLLASAGGAEAFEREAETWVNLGLHPQIVSCFYVRQVRGTPRVFAEFVGGGSLHRWIREGRVERIEDILDLAIQVAWGLHYAHEQGLVHQDVKPANVMVTSDGLAKITDFGLARAGGVAAPLPAAATTGTGSVLVSAGGMTPAYCSPEQLAGAQLTRRTDIWSWAVSLLEIFVGEVSWQSGAVAPTVLNEHLARVPLNAGAPPIPEPVVDLLRRCWERDPNHRPPTMQVLADELTQIHEALVGRPYPRRRPRAGRDTADSLNNRAVSLLDLGREEEATRLWRLAQGRQAHHVESTFNAVIHSWKHGEISDGEALLKMQELHRTETTSVRDQHLLGKIYIALAEYEPALDCLSEAHAAEPDHPEIIRDRSLALCGLAAHSGADESWKDARLSLQSALDTGQLDPQLITAYVAAMQHTGEELAAQRFYGDVQQRVHELPPELSEAMTSFLPRSEIVCQWKAFTESVRTVCLSRDGGLAAAVGDGHLLISFDTTNGERRTTNREGSRTATAMALAADSCTAIVASEGEPVHLVGLLSGGKRSTLQHHQGTITCLAVSADGSLVAGGSSDRRARLWGLADGRLLRQLEGHTGAVTAVAITRDASIMLSGSLDSSVRVWETASGVCSFVLAGHTGAVRGVAVSPDARRALSGGEDGTVRLWDLDRGECVRTLKGHSKPVTAVCFSADGCQGLSASADGSVRRWNLATGMPSIVTRFSEAVTSFTLGDDDRLALAVSGTTISLLRPFARRPYHLPYALSMPVSSEEVESLSEAFDRQLERARSLYGEGRLDEALKALSAARSLRGFERAAEGVALWQEVVQAFPRKGLLAAWERSSVEALSASVTAIAAHEQGSRALVGLADGRLVLVATDSGEVILTLEGHDQLVSDAAFSEDGELALTASWDCRIMLWDLSRGDAVATFSGHDDYVLGVAIVPSSEHLLSTGSDGTTRLWRLDTEDVSEMLDRSESSVASCAVSGDGCYAVTGGWDAAIRLWDLKGRALLGVLEGHTQAVTAVEISPDGITALSASTDRSLRLWDLKSGRCLRALQGHRDEVTSVAWAPGGRFAASGSKDGSIRLWDLRASRSVRTFEGHTGAVTAVGFADGGATLLSGGQDATFRLWHLDWEPDVHRSSEWDEHARATVELFLHQLLERAELPPANVPINITEGHLRALRADLRTQGFGWLQEETIKTQLRETALTWHGSTSAWESIRSAWQRRAQSGKRSTWWRRAPLRGAIGAIMTAAIVAVLIPTISFLVKVDLDEESLARQRTLSGLALAPQYDPSQELPCDTSDHDLYLAWALDPTLADSLAVTCLCEVAGEDTVISLLDRFRELSRRVEADPDELEPPRERYIILPEPTGESGGRTVSDELERFNRLCLTVFSVLDDREVEILGHYLVSPEPAVRELVAAAMAVRGDEESADLLRSAATHHEAGIRLAVARTLRPLIGSGRLSGRQALSLVEGMGDDPVPEIRRQAVRALSLFADDRALRLADILGRDPDPATAAAAREMSHEIAAKTGSRRP